MVDFGADGSYGKSSKKLKEHYGIEVPISAIRITTHNHGAAMAEARDLRLESKLPKGGVTTVIGQTDGSMVPVVTIKPIENEESPKDGRKRRSLGWEEARLSLARDIDKVTPYYAATMRSVEESVHLLVDCLIKAGAGELTMLHCMGDGATWIVLRIMKHLETLGCHVTFLLDFYHLGEYLAEAGEVIRPDLKRTWLTKQQERAKENRIDEVLAELAAHCESHDVALCCRTRGIGDRHECPAATCKRYIETRLSQLDYKGAIEAGLPIGTGEVEGGHRSVIQPRIKPSGAWWLVSSIEKILALRTTRANNEWEPYWTQLRQAAA